MRSDLKFLEDGYNRIDHRLNVVRPSSNQEREFLVELQNFFQDRYLELTSGIAPVNLTITKPPPS